MTIKEDKPVGLTKINGLILKKMVIGGANELNNNKQLVDSLNVFPVPDGDTGTNMSLTALAAAREIEKSHSLKIGEIAKLAANGSLRGARGNSGVILSQLFRGFSKGLDSLEEAGTKELAAAIKKGMETAYKAVMKPKEGTILTVARACAESAEKNAEKITDIEEFLEKMIEDAHSTLLQTKEMLPVLKQADVVDAGGKGLLCILEGAFKNVHTKEEIAVEEPSKSASIDFSALASVENQSITFGYCTEFLIYVKQAEDSVVNKLKSFLGTIGDSIVVVHDEDLIKVHVHTDHPGLAMEKALTLGSLSGMKIDNMREQHTNKIDFSGKKEKVSSASIPKKTQKKVGFLSVSMGSGLSDIFKNLGVDEVVEGGQTMNPSTEDILRAVERIPAQNVVLLPNNKNIILAAEQAAKLYDKKKIAVLPTKSIPEGIAAMFHYEEDAEMEEMLKDMKHGYEDVSTAMVTYAVRDTIFGEQEIKEGDILGMLQGEISVVEKNVLECTKELLKKTVKEEHDMISLYYGSDVKKEEAEELEIYTKNAYPDCEIELHYGGQPLYYYIISVE